MTKLLAIQPFGFAP
jgi:hypothetical protein